jgi:hypothetical protein
VATQIPTLYIHTSGGRGRGGALKLDRCRAFDLFASVDAHLCSQEGYKRSFHAADRPERIFENKMISYSTLQRFYREEVMQGTVVNSGICKELFNKLVVYLILFNAQKDRFTKTGREKDDCTPLLQVCTVKKGLLFSRLQPGCHLPNSPRSGIIKLIPARESLVNDIPAGDVKTANPFLQCVHDLFA